ncbi:MAG: hypothetical protein P4L33_10100 [Capsulimonadaceae bacterium]|nr:hypothetical protein [Capsulimonadaceae bacterium]
MCVLKRHVADKIQDSSCRRSRTGLARASFTPAIDDASSTRVRPFAANDRLQRTS